MYGSESALSFISQPVSSHEGLPKLKRPPCTDHAGARVTSKLHIKKQHCIEDQAGDWPFEMRFAISPSTKWGEQTTLDFGRRLGHRVSKWVGCHC